MGRRTALQVRPAARTGGGPGGGSFESMCAGSCMGGITVCHDTTECGTGEVCCPFPLGFSGCVAGTTCP